jgi:hypothetical protein
VPERPITTSLYERTLKRKRWFESAEAMYRSLENRPPFSTWRRDILRDYCEHATRPVRDGGVELKCPPEIEAAFYTRACEFLGLSTILEISSQLLLILGERSASTAMKIADKLAAQLVNCRVVKVPFSADGTSGNSRAVGA